MHCERLDSTRCRKQKKLLTSRRQRLQVVKALFCEAASGLCGTSRQHVLLASRNERTLEVEVLHDTLAISMIQPFGKWVDLEFYA